MPLEFLQTIHLKKDGSGKVLRQYYFRPLVGQVIRAFESFTGKQLPVAFMCEGALRQAALKMGSGVEYRTHGRDSNGSGWEF